MFGSGRRVFRPRTPVVRVVDADAGGEICRGRGLSATGVGNCDGGVHGRTLWCGTAEVDDRGQSGLSAAQPPKLSSSRFSPAKWWTHPSALGWRAGRSSNLMSAVTGGTAELPARPHGLCDQGGQRSANASDPPCPRRGAASAGRTPDRRRVRCGLSGTAPFRGARRTVRLTMTSQPGISPRDTAGRVEGAESTLIEPKGISRKRRPLPLTGAGWTRRS